MNGMSRLPTSAWARTTRGSEVLLLWATVNPNLGSIRNHLRYLDLLKKLGLD
jgi:hypothetical protein